MDLPPAHKVCPICGTTAHHNASVCPTCGTTLNEIQPRDPATGRAAATTPFAYANQHGETDLFEGELRQRGQSIFRIITAILLVALCGSAALLLVPLFSSLSPDQMQATLTNNQNLPPSITAAVQETSLPIVLATNTQRPTPSFMTVTPAPPTATPNPPPTPCVRTVQPGDTLYAIALACGYREPSIIDVIVVENGLSSPDSLTVGQEIVVPAPTASAAPSQPSTETPAVDSRLPQGIALAALASESTFAPGVTPTSTLQPGVMWHEVQPNETMISIAVQYGANAEILSQLNPEVPFLQCDFEFDSGGPRCIVQLGIGQQIRVPAPTATPTLPPTASGSETPTPTLTPTFNAPNALSPGDRALFQTDQLITLRWVTTGTLSSDTIYRVSVRDLTAGQEYVVETRELFFIIPTEWQGDDLRRHEYEWVVSVVSTREETIPVFSTQPRIFIWESRREG